MINIEQAKLAIVGYFSREAAERYCILGGSALLALCSLLLWLKFSDQFSVALAVTLALIALLLAATGLSLLIRDSQNRQGLIETLTAGDLGVTEQALGIERVRMQKVADNYQNLRYTFAALALAGALLIAFTHHHITHAIAIGLLIFALSGLVIDRYSEVRARLYLGNLQVQN